MKKLVSIFFLIIYTATAFGVIVNFHYCDHVLTRISISNLNGKCACNGRSFMTKDCCKDKILCLKVSSLRESPQPVVITPKYYQLDFATSTDPALVILVTNSPKSIISINWHDPNLPKTIYLLNRVFRI